MKSRTRDIMSDFRLLLRRVVTGPPVLAALPALVLGGFWLGGEDMLIMTALGFPICMLFSGAFRLRPKRGRRANDAQDDPDGFMDELGNALELAERSSLHTGCILIALDEYDTLRDRLGHATMDAFLLQTGDRLGGALRGRDRVCRLSENVFGILLAPVRQLNLENVLDLTGRLQTAVEAPFALDGTTIYVSASTGVALDTHLKRRTGSALYDAAMIALEDATRHSPSATRVYSQNMAARGRATAILPIDLADALENGQIQPWFQPQVSTDTGQVTGVEALARWMHPARGMISPAEFLPTLEDTGMMERLSEVMLYQSLGALRGWDAAGLNVPHIGVNFSTQELRNPKLVEKIEWELDRFDLTPERLTIEILETVVAMSPDDTIVRNISGLSELGCHIDLDDFGTGHASISSIRRFDVHRLKIDRSFVMKVDRDPEQQRMVSAILLMAERLELDTLAEGVETPGEHAMLAQLGCGHVQGFGIGRPMAMNQCPDWITAHRATLQAPPLIGRQAG